MPSETFSQVDSHTWETPPGVRFLDAYAEGAEGGFRGAEGGIVEGGLPVDGEETLYMYVGGQGERPSGGFNGGGDGGTGEPNSGSVDAGGGGGASDIRRGGDSLDDRVLVAAGAGGGGDESSIVGTDTDIGYGGAGGADNGQDGEDADANDDFAEGGSGGTQTEGSSFGSGGSGNSADAGDNGEAGGGGGGGWYGGGGGDVASSGTNTSVAAGGGGGSNYVGEMENVSTQRGGSTGDGYIEIKYADRPEDLSSSLSGYTTIDLSWDSGGSDIDSYDIYRSKDSDIDISSTSPIDNVSSETTSYSDSELQEGTTYYYLVVSKFDAARTKSIEVSTQTQLPAPVDMSVVDFDDTTADLSWTLESSDENGIRVFRSLSGDDFTEIDDLSNGTTEYTDTSLLNGRDYSYYVEVYTDELEELTDSVDLQTNLNNPTDLITDSNERGSIDVEWESSLNNGEFDVELEDLDEEDTQETTTVDYTTKEISFTEDIDDAIEYEIRIRSTTQDTTGDFQSITSLSFLPSSLISNIEYNTDRNVVISFQKIDNFDGGYFEIYRSTEKSQRGDMIRRVPDTREKVVDASTKPFNTYYYTVRRVIE